MDGRNFVKDNEGKLYCIEPMIRENLCNLWLK